MFTFPTDIKDEFVSFSGDENEVKDVHSRNIKHVRILLLYFIKYSVLEKIKKENSTVVVTLPTPKKLIADNTTVSIKIGAKSDNSDVIKVVCKKLISLIFLDNHKIYEKSIVYNEISFKKFTDNLFIIPICLNTTDLSGVKQVTLLA
ncbi:hypothetical protein RI543_002611 [Arxiozyma heterogenica]|uniref:Uncharacterized protein n=1 Tax=Arxiozyma heterogenica TaxID=278026 RepID=A0AAN7WM11_9SACH|nr:hypothetical protein RI543_002611 [Kazachstania heterogenica]